jgi:branched-chain amino acid transport system ATP-binding protein
VTLHLDNVIVGYDGTAVLRGVTLTVPPGSVVALLGPNGAGKTTLLRTMSGLLPPSSGRIVVDQTDITTASPHHMVEQGICHITEGRAVFPSLTVQENLRMLGADDPDKVDLAVTTFPVLGRKLKQVAGTMSGGEQQMLALSRAYLTRARYVLLDEVSMGLAPIVVEEIFTFLRALATSGAALLLVEQYVRKALDLADLVYVLNKGRIQFAGEAVELDADRLAESYLGAAS